jgi:hypothetical protein
MKNLKVTKETIKSFGVKCPEDFKTNQKWREIIDGFNFLHDEDYKENKIGCFYGVNIYGGFVYSENVENFKEILTIDEAHAYLFGESETPTTEETTFQKLTNAGFKRIELQDDLIFKKFGQYPFLMEYVVINGCSYFWKSYDNPNEVTLQIFTKNGSIKSQHVLPIDKVLEDIKKYKS